MKVMYVDYREEEEELLPILARFATIRYEFDGTISITQPTMTLTIADPSTSPKTYSATTKSGADNDSDDWGND